MITHKNTAIAYINKTAPSTLLTRQEKAQYIYDFFWPTINRFSRPNIYIRFAVFCIAHPITQKD